MELNINTAGVGEVAIPLLIIALLAGYHFLRKAFRRSPHRWRSAPESAGIELDLDLLGGPKQLAGYVSGFYVYVEAIIDRANSSRYKRVYDRWTIVVQLPDEPSLDFSISPVSAIERIGLGIPSFWKKTIELDDPPFDWTFRCSGNPAQLRSALSQEVRDLMLPIHTLKLHHNQLSCSVTHAEPNRRGRIEEAVLTLIKIAAQLSSVDQSKSNSHE